METLLVTDTVAAAIITLLLQISISHLSSYIESGGVIVTAKGSSNALIGVISFPTRRD